MHYIGRIDINIYKCITEDINTDEVIITDERITHIRERHSVDYEKIASLICETLQKPDYIFEDSTRTNTGLVIRKVKAGDTYIQLVLRVHTSEDKSGYGNSIISAWTISESRLKNYLRNKKVLYSRE